jgi:hypothetical protein
MHIYVFEYTLPDGFIASQKGSRQTWTLSYLMNATDVWLRATKSTLTPKVPPHLKSFATKLSPMESLPDKSGDAHPSYSITVAGYVSRHGEPW